MINQDKETHQNDKKRLIGDFYIFESGFSKSEVKRIISICNSFKLDNGQIMANDNNVSNIRRSKIAWIPKNETTFWIYNRLIAMIFEANCTWDFKINEFHQVIQYSEYHESYRGCYKCHYDIASSPPGVFRKISVIVQLSNHDEYEGGGVVLCTPANMENLLSKGIGDVILFPSFMPHEVLPVTSGKRRSLVLWIEGPPFQ